GRTRSRHADAAEIAGMIPLERTLAALSFSDRNVGGCGECREFRRGSAVEHAASRDQQGRLCTLQQADQFVLLPEVGRRRPNGPYSLSEKRFREIEGLRLHVLTEGQ